MTLVLSYHPFLLPIFNAITITSKPAEWGEWNEPELKQLPLEAYEPFEWSDVVGMRIEDVFDKIRGERAAFERITIMEPGHLTHGMPAQIYWQLRDSAAGMVYEIGVTDGRVYLGDFSVVDLDILR